MSLFKNHINKQVGYYESFKEEKLSSFTYSDFLQVRGKLLLDCIHEHGVHKSIVLLELGCGSGLFSNYFQENLNLKMYCGIEPALNRLLAAKRRGMFGSYCKATGECLPFKDNSFSVIFGNGVLHHVADIKNVMSECLRVIKPGGLMVFIEPNRLNPIFFTQAVIMKIERGILKLSFQKIKFHLENTFDKLTVKIKWLNSYRWPYRDIRIPKKILTKIESILNIPSLATHKVLIVKCHKKINHKI